MSEEERKEEENKEESEGISEDLERIIKTVEEEIVLPEEAELEEEVPEIEETVIEETREMAEEESIYSIINSINLMKAELRRIYDKIDNLENTIKYLIDSVNEIKSVILIVSHSRERKVEKESTEEGLINGLNKTIELAEDAIYSTLDSDIVRAIKIEALRFDLERLLEKAKEKQIMIPRDMQSRVREVLGNLQKEAIILRKRIMGS